VTDTDNRLATWAKCCFLFLLATKKQQNNMRKTRVGFSELTRGKRVFTTIVFFFRESGESRECEQLINFYLTSNHKNLKGGVVLWIYCEVPPSLYCFFFFVFSEKIKFQKCVYMAAFWPKKKPKMCIYGSILIPKTDTNMYMLQHFDQKKTKCVYIAAFW